MKFSMVLPTIGRKKELVDFLDSLKGAMDALGEFGSLELILVDQNSLSFGLQKIAQSYSQYFMIHYIHSSTKGLSFNRNVGLKFAKGDIVCFPDDDCLYYTDTLTSVIDFFSLNLSTDVVLGRIYDRDDKVNIIKSWPSINKKVTPLNFYFLSSSITIFLRQRAVVSFDESLGAGAKYGSCEDPDFLCRVLKEYRACYSPSISVWHPAPDMSRMCLSRVESYSSGFGYFIRKDMSFLKVMLLIMLLGKKMTQYIFIKKNFVAGYFSAFYRGLISGLFKRYD